MLLISDRQNMSPKCPCTVLLCYAALAKRNLGLARSITSLSYTRAREVVLAKFRAIGVDTSRMELHSLRISSLRYRRN